MQVDNWNPILLPSPNTYKMINAFTGTWQIIRYIVHIYFNSTSGHNDQIVIWTKHAGQQINTFWFGVVNPLAAEFFCNPAIGMKIIFKFFTYLHLAWVFSMFTVCTDFFLWYSCFLGWEMKLRSYLHYRVTIYIKILKRRTRNPISALMY